jgi:hypothetical protein
MDTPKKRGPKPKGDKPMTATERGRLYRQRLKAAGYVRHVIDLPPKVIEIVEKLCEITGQSKREVISDVAENALVEWAVETEPSLPALKAALEERERRRREAQSESEK